MAMKNEPHIPILIDQVIAQFEGVKLLTFFEGTLGAGGHARAILEAHPEIQRYIGCDKDPQALAIARERLAPWAHKIDFVQGDFAKLDEHLIQRGIQSVDGFFLTSECRPCN